MIDQCDTTHGSPFRQSYPLECRCFAKSVIVKSNELFAPDFRYLCSTLIYLCSTKPQSQQFCKQRLKAIRDSFVSWYNKVPIRRLPNWLPICLRGEWKVPQKFHGLGLIEQKRKAEVFSLRLSDCVKLCSHKPWCVRGEAACPHRQVLT